MFVITKLIYARCCRSTSYVVICQTVISHHKQIHSDYKKTCASKYLNRMKNTTFSFKRDLKVVYHHLKS